MRSGFYRVGLGFLALVGFLFVSGTLHADPTSISKSRVQEGLSDFTDSEKPAEYAWQKSRPGWTRQLSSEFGGRLFRLSFISARRIMPATRLLERHRTKPTSFRLITIRPTIWRAVSASDRSWPETSRLTSEPVGI